MLFAFFSTRHAYAGVMTRLFVRRRRTDVFVYNIDAGSRGEVYALFSHQLDYDMIAKLLAELTYAKESVNLAIVGPYTVKVLWTARQGELTVPGYCRRGIELTIFEHVLGTWEPRCERWNLPKHELSAHVRMVSHEHGVDWAGELGLRA